jgi:hypothetical protein
MLLYPFQIKRIISKSTKISPEMAFLARLSVFSTTYVGETMRFLLIVPSRKTC